MKAALVLSMALKALGAVLEIAGQIVITRLGSVELFGEYSFNVAIAEMVCWVFFSGIVKVNAFYVANGYDLRAWRRKYFLLFVFPVIIVLAAGFGLLWSAAAAVAVLAALGYAFQMNLSSIALGCRKYRVSLLGEYLVSRLVIVAGALVLAWTNRLTPMSVTVLYALGYVGSVAFFLIVRSKVRQGDLELSSAQRKMLPRQTLTFQMTDVANGLVNQAPTIVQYLFAGAFQAGVLSVVLVTRKVISFVAGPTAKVYLPEFARLYGEGDFTGLKRVYSDIVILQMCFVLPICLVMVGASSEILSIYNPALAEYGSYMQFASLIFFVMVLFGPQGNFLSMTGKEHVEAWMKWASLAAMVVAMALTFGDPLFVMYGIAAQVLVDSFGKLYFVMRAVGGFPIGIRDALKLAIPFACALAVLCASGLSGATKLGAACGMACLLCAVLVFAFYGDAIRKRLSRKR